MPFLDVPSSPGESSLSAKPELLPHLKLKPSDPGPAAVPRRGSPPLTKVFVNATYADEVPEQHEAEKLKGIVNCVVSDVRETADKAGKPSLVIDATLAPTPIQQSKRDKSYKQWLIQVILEKVEERIGVELSRNYTEPNIKSKGILSPRTAVIPMDAETFERITAAKAKEKGSERIQLLDEDEVALLTTSSTGDAREEKPKGKGKKGMTEGTVEGGRVATAAPERSGKPVTPKHEFEVLAPMGTGTRKRFIMTISLPEEPISVEQDLTGIALSLMSDFLDFTSQVYTLLTPLPRDIDVESVLQSADGVEWSVEAKALRIQGLLK
ncbi:hypothetical protein QFC22_006024 [Naganishia vaughanmartiniae]|uniref:Uncharacterized protein n=1 Tax=Naganishia vaughanmartiniae TaxID=1424756 RepID=A0ACC2WN46_9TREE|nr:hypothetical protein QFC22_006024 [Naganishia vaughanmartiniae]